MYCSQKLGEDFAKFCGLLRVYELYDFYYMTLNNKTGTDIHRRLKAVLHFQVLKENHFQKYRDISVTLKFDLGT